MESLLASGFRNAMKEKAKKAKDPSLMSEMSYPISYPSTFLPLDYMNGVRANITEIDRDINYIYDSIGIGEGSIVMLVGKPGSAKTTFAVQAATSIVSRFPDSAVMHEDIENGTSIPRIQTISGWNSRMIASKYIPRNEGINSNSFFYRLDAFCKQKVELAEKFPERLKYFTGIIDAYGKPVYKLIPSVVILDSLPLLVPEGMTEEEELAGNMSAAQVAKINAQIFRRISQPLKKANVILFVINHINQNININPFAPKSSQINYLKSNEAIPGKNRNSIARGKAI